MKPINAVAGLFRNEFSAQMKVSEHFDELRSRLLKCLWVFCLGFIGFYFVSDSLMAVLKYPLFFGFT